MRTLRVFFNDKSAHEAFQHPADDVTTVRHAQRIWVHADGSQTWFRSQDAEVRGLSWDDIWYDDKVRLTGEAIARLEAMRRPSSA